MSISNEFELDLDLDDDTTQGLKKGKYNSRLPFCYLSVPPEILSPDGSVWLHAVEALKTNHKVYSSVLRVRVITNTHRGVTVTVPILTRTMYLKYLDLRFRIRNSDLVLITFPELYVSGSPYNKKEIYLNASDFKVCDDTN